MDKRWRNLILLFILIIVVAGVYILLTSSNIIGGGDLQKVATKHNFSLTTLEFTSNTLSLDEINSLKSEMSAVKDSSGVKEIVIDKLDLMISAVNFYDEYDSLLVNLENGVDSCSYRSTISSLLLKVDSLLDLAVSFNEKIAGMGNVQYSGINTASIYGSKAVLVGYSDSLGDLCE